MMKGLHAVVGIALLVVLMPAQPAAAAGPQEPVGNVVAVRGSVVAVSAEGAVRPLAIKDPVYRQDTIQTGNGRIQLMFTDNTLISLGREAEMKIAEYEWKPETQTGAMKTKIKEGAFRVMGGAITRMAPQDFTTETPAATIGIRGSMYSGRISADTLTVVFQGGKGIEVTNEAGSVVITRPGFGTRVPNPGEAPIRPVRFGAADLRDIDEGMAEGEAPAAQEEPKETKGEAEQQEESSGDTPEGEEEAGQSPSQEAAAADAPGSEEDPAAASSPVQATGGSDSSTEGEAPPAGAALNGWETTSEPTPSGTDSLKTGFSDTGLIIYDAAAITQIVETTSAATQQESIVKEVTETATKISPPPNTGRFLASEESWGAVSGRNSWFGPVDGQVQEGVVTATFNSRGTNSQANFNLTESEPDRPYSRVHYAHRWADAGSWYQSSWESYDSLGQFLLFHRHEFSYSPDQTVLYQGFGYFGIESPSAPSSGTAVYTGPLHVLPSAENNSAILRSHGMIMWVNFDNQTALGLIDSRAAGGDFLDEGLFYGRVSGSRLTNIQFLGTGHNASGADLIHLLTGGTGNFYGNVHQGFGWSGSGSSMLTAGSTPWSNFDLLAAGFRGTQLLPSQIRNQEWKGYFGGLAGAGSSLTMGGLRLVLNAGAGTVGGSFNLGTGLMVGADANLASAYVADSWFFARLAAGSESSLSDQGLIMASLPWEQWSTHFTWGWWVLPDQGPATLTDNFWVAGNTTADLRNKLAALVSVSATGTYRGQTRAVLYDGTLDLLRQYRELIGSSEISVNFGASSFAGLLNFSSTGGPRLDFSGKVSGSGISAAKLRVDGQTAPGSFGLAGTFYGAELQGLAGNFHADLSAESRMTGIFGAEKASPATAQLKGRYLGMITNASSGNNLWRGGISGVAQGGILSGEASTSGLAGGTKSFPLSFFSPLKSPDPVQIGRVEGWRTIWGIPWDDAEKIYFHASSRRTVNLLGADHTFHHLGFNSWNQGEFSYFLQAQQHFGSLASGAYGSFSEAGFMGMASPTVPATGIDHYYGEFLLGGWFNGQPDTLHANHGWWQMGVNWQNRKVVGALNKSGGPMFFFGDVLESGQLTNVRMAGSALIPSGGSMAQPFGMNGSGSFGQFYGSQQQGFGVTGAGSLFDLKYPGAITAGNWSMLMAGFKGPVLPDQVAPAIGSVRQGFLVGLAEVVYSPDFNRRIFMNANAADFQLTVDKGGGGLSGTLSAASLDRQVTISKLEVGGAHGSAYVDDDWLVAILGCAAGNCIQHNGTSGTIKSSGGYLVSTPFPVSEHLTWGYWEAAYEEPGTGQQYHLHAPGSLWVAGTRTPQSYVRSLLESSTTISATYGGIAQAYRLDAVDHSRDAFLQGDARLEVNFGSRTVTGGFNFVERFLKLTGGSVSAGGFGAGIEGAVGSRVNGAFFGPRAEAVGGSFNASFNGDGTYLGIFGGRLVNGPLP